MSPAPDALLAEVTRLGIRLMVNGGKLRVEAPAGTLTPELRTALAASKPAILARLRVSLALAPPTPARPRPEGACRMCGGLDYWLSIHGGLACEICHPPAVEDLVAERIFLLHGEAPDA